MENFKLILENTGHTGKEIGEAFKLLYKQIQSYLQVHPEFKI